MRRFAARSIVVVVASVVSLIGASSSSAAEPKRLSEKMGERVTRGAIEEALDSLDSDQNRERLGRILNSPQMNAAMHDLTASIVSGVFDGVADGAKRRLPAVDFPQAIAEGMNRHITPAIGRVTYRVVDSALEASLAPKHTAKLERLGEQATHAAIRGLAHGIEQDLGPALAATLNKDMGPAVAVMIERDIMPAVGRGLNSPEMQIAVTNLTNAIATGLVAGTDEALDDANAARPAGEESRLEVFGGRMAIGYGAAVFLVFAFGTLLVVLSVLLVRSARRQRKQSRESRLREETLLRLIEGLDADHPELKTDMRALVREQLETRS